MLYADSDQYHVRNMSCTVFTQNHKWENAIFMPEDTESFEAKSRLCYVLEVKVAGAALLVGRD